MKIQTPFFAFFFCLVLGAGYAQNDFPISAVMFMQADDGAEYVDMELEIWKPVHAQRIRDGQINAWFLYQVVSPDGGNRDYNYMVVEVYPNWAALENPFENAEKVFKEVHGEEVDLDAVMQRTDNARDMVGTDWWVRREWIQKDDYSVDELKYVVLDWMDVNPGHEDGYMEMEKEYYMPVHQARVDAGNILTWGLWSKMGYSESQGSVDHATSAGYASFEALMNAYPEDAWQNAHEDVDQDVIYKKMREHRTMTGSTIMRLVDYVIPVE